MGCTASGLAWWSWCSSRFSLAGCAWIQRSSVSSSPDRVEGILARGQSSLSQTGRFVAFDSLANNLVAGDTNGVADVFVRDHRGTTERVSIATDETQADGASRNAAISDDGRFVAFEISFAWPANCPGRRRTCATACPPHRCFSGRSAQKNWGVPIGRRPDLNLSR